MTSSNSLGSIFQVLTKRSPERLAYGWAMVSATADGEQIEDLQGDLIDPMDLEKASVDFMLAYRESGVMHEGPPQASVIASLVTTPELTKALGIPNGSVPVGWIIGVKVHDEAVWKRVESGELKMFSIQGDAERQAVTA